MKKGSILYFEVRPFGYAVRCLAVALSVFCVVQHSGADIVVDGVNHGLSYELTGKAGSVSMDSGMLIIGSKGMINGNLQVLGGKVFVEGGAGNVMGLALHGGEMVVLGGNFHAPVVYSGALELDGEVKVTGGLSLQGGTGTITKVDKLNGGIEMLNSAVLYLDDLDVHGVVSVKDSAIVYVGDGFLTDATLNPFGKVTQVLPGSIFARTGQLEFQIDSGASLYVGVIPEPAVVGLLLLGGSGLLVMRRIQRLV